MTRYAYLLEATPYDPVTDAPVTVRYCFGDDPTVTTLDGEEWLPVLTSGPDFSFTFFDGDFTGALQSGFGVVTIDAAMGEIDDHLGYVWSGCSVKIWEGVEGDPFANYTMIFDGMAEGLTVDELLRVTLALRPFDSMLNEPVLTATYAGTGGAEGDANAKGRFKPWSSGQCLNVEPELIDGANWVYQFHGYGAAEAVLAAYDNGTAFGAALGDYASYAALVSANIPAGEWATCLAEGLVRFGAQPYGVLTLDVKGDNAGSGGYITKPGAIVQRLLELRTGLTAPDRIDTASLSAFDTAVAADIDLYITDQITVGEVAQAIARSCNGYAGFSPLGKFVMGRVAFDTPIIKIGSEDNPDLFGDEMDYIASRIARLPARAPFWRRRLGYQRCYRVHTQSEISFPDVTDISGLGDLATQDTAPPTMAIQWNKTYTNGSANALNDITQSAVLHGLTADGSAAIATDPSFWWLGRKVRPRRYEYNGAGASSILTLGGAGKKGFICYATGQTTFAIATGSGVNRLLYSEEFGNAAWIKSNATAVDDQGYSPWGTLTFSEIEDASGTQYGHVRQAVTVPNDSNTHCVSVFIEKTSGATNTVGVNVSLSGGTGVARTTRLNPNTGVVTGTGASVEDYGSHWRLITTITNNSTGNTSLEFRLHPASGTNSGDNPGSDNVAATGTIRAGGAQVELNRSTPSGYIRTRDTTSLHFRWGFVWREADGTWKYANNSTAVSFTPDATHLALGWMECGSGGLVTGAGLFAQPVTLLQAAQPGLVTTADMENGAVTAPKVSDGAVTTPKLANNAVTTPVVAQGAVTAAYKSEKMSAQTMSLNTNWQTITSLSVTINAAADDKIDIQVGLDFISISRDDRGYKFGMRLLKDGAALSTRTGWAGEAESDRTTTPTSHYFNGSVSFIVDGDGASHTYTVQIQFMANEQFRLTYPDALYCAGGFMRALHLKKAA